MATAMRARSVIDGRFELEHLAGEGGMGKVYRAIDRKAGMPVALKVLSGPDGSVARFLREGRILAELSHPRIVRYISSGTMATGEPYLAMEWLDGESLSARLMRGALSPQESVTLARAAADALAMAHARGIVHRDIKPSNLFLVGGDVENLKVLDFGIARRARPSLVLTRPTGVLGTPGYMAPEQVQGGSESLGPQADIFSLGAVLFECLTGRPAFEAVHVLALLAKLLLEEAPRVREILPDVPAALDALVRRMLLKDPQKRPQDGAALMSAIDALGAFDSSPPSIQRPREVLAVGERRLVSIVVALPKMEEGDGEAETELVGGVPREILARLRAAMEALDARVEALAGGGVVVLLSGAASPKDQAALAARCALHMHALLPGAPIALLTRWAEDTGRMPVGQLLEQASSMLAEEASPDRARATLQSIRVDAVTRALLDARFEVVEEAGRTVLCGESEDEEVEGRLLLGRVTPYVGRQRELKNLFELIIESFNEGSAVAALVTAPPGMGKSRLRRELMRKVRDARPDVAVGLGRGDSIGAGSAFMMIGTAFRSALGIATGEPAAAQREKIVSLVTAFVEEGSRRRVSEFLGEMVGAGFPDDDSPQLRMARQNASLMADQIQTAYIDFVRAASAAQPVLLVLEDLHWGDGPSIKLIDAALRELHDKPYAVLALARPEVHDSFPQLWAARRLQEIRMTGLSRRAAESLVRSVLGAEVKAEAVAAIVERADGNAFFLEELIRAVAEGRGEVMPETVLGMVEARLRTLTLEERRYLRAASIFGETFWPRGVQALLGEEGKSGIDHLDRLMERELVARQREGRFAGEEEFVFRHALIQEAAYATLTERDVEAGHVLAGEWLLAAGEQDPRLIGTHFERGKDAGRAVRFYLRAAEQAMYGADNVAVISLSERAIGLGAEGEVAAALWAIQAEARLWSDDFTQALRAAEAARRLATRGGKNECRALWSAVCSALSLQRADALREPLQRMLEIEPVPEGVPPLVAAHNAAVVALLLSGARDLAESYLHNCEKIAAPLSDLDPYVTGWLRFTQTMWLEVAEAEIFHALQHCRAAVACFEQAGASFAQAGDRPSVLGIVIHLGELLVRLGAYEQAEEILQRALCSGSSDRGERWYRVWLLAKVYLAAMELGRAQELAAPWVEDASVQSQGIVLLCFGSVLAEADLLAGRLGEAEERARALHAMMPATTMGLIPHVLLAEVRLARGDALEALHLAEEWLGISHAMRMRHELTTRVRLLQARALHLLGRIEEARTTLRDARDDLLARADKISEPDLRRSFLERVPANAATLSLYGDWFGE